MKVPATDPLSINENCLRGAGCQPLAIASGFVLIRRKLVASIEAVDSISGRPDRFRQFEVGKVRLPMLINIDVGNDHELVSLVVP
jgi:hypothetical protein